MILFLAILSILLTLIALALPLWGTKRVMNGAARTALPQVTASFTAALAVLVLRLAEVRLRAQAQDWSAIGDTCGFTLALAVVFVLIVVVLNLFSLFLTESHRPSFRGHRPEGKGKNHR